MSILDLSLLLMWTFIAVCFPLDAALNVSQRFLYVVSSFSSVSKNIFISAFISFFIQSTFKSQLFSFHEAVWFWVSFWILSSNLIALWSEKTVCYDFRSFVFAEGWFTSNYLVIFRVGVMWCWQECISWIWGGELCKCLLGLLGPGLSSSPGYPCSFSV